MMTFGVVHAWRTAHPELCDGPDDPVEQTIAEIKVLTGWDDDHPLVIGLPVALLLFRKKP